MRFSFAIAFAAVMIPVLAISQQDVVDPAQALGLLRSVPTPESYRTVCSVMSHALEQYVFIDNLVTGGEYPETAVADFRTHMLAECSAAVDAVVPTYDFHRRMADSALRARDGHTGWVSPPAASAFAFYVPAALIYNRADADTETGDLVYQLIDNGVFAGREQVWKAAYAATYGDAELASLEAGMVAAKTSPLVRIGLCAAAEAAAAGLIPASASKPDALAVLPHEPVPPTEFFTAVADGFSSARTRGQRSALALSSFGTVYIGREFFSSYARTILADGLNNIVGGYDVELEDGTKFAIRPLAVAAADIPTDGGDDAVRTWFEDREFNNEQEHTTAAAAAQPQPRRRFEYQQAEHADTLAAAAIARSQSMAAAEAGVAAMPSSGARADVVTGADYTPAKVLTSGTFISSFSHEPTRTAVVQITTYAPMLPNTPAGTAENQWLDELDAALTAAAATGYVQAGQGNLVVDVRLNGGGYVELTALVIDKVAGSVVMTRDSSAKGPAGKKKQLTDVSPNHPKMIFRVFNRMSLQAEGATSPDSDLVSAYPIYGDIPLFAEWGAKHVSSQEYSTRRHPNPFNNDANGGDAEAHPHPHYTRLAFYPNLGYYNAMGGAITGKGDGYTVLPGEFPPAAYDKLMKLATKKYDNFTNDLRNTVVTIGPFTASGGADTAYALSQMGAARVVASSGSPSAGMDIGGNDQKGLVPGGDTVQLVEMIFRDRPDLQKLWSKGQPWPCKADWRASNFAIVPMHPSPAIAHGHDVNSREFQRDPVGMTVWHATPLGKMSAACPEHLWGSAEDAGAWCTKLYRAGAFKRECDVGMVLPALAVTNSSTYVGFGCGESGRWIRERPATAGSCRPGWQFDPDWNFGPNNTHERCTKIVCPKGQHMDARVGFCVAGSTKNIPVGMAVLLGCCGVIVVAAAVFSVVLIVKKMRSKRNYEAIEDDASESKL